MIAAVVDDSSGVSDGVPDPKHDDVRLAEDGTEENLPEINFELIVSIWKKVVDDILGNGDIQQDLHLCTFHNLNLSKFKVISSLEIVGPKYRIECVMCMSKYKKCRKKYKMFEYRQSVASEVLYRRGVNRDDADRRSPLVMFAVNQFIHRRVVKQSTRGQYA